MLIKVKGQIRNYTETNSNVQRTENENILIKQTQRN